MHQKYHRDAEEPREHFEVTDLKRNYKIKYLKPSSRLFMLFLVQRCDLNAVFVDSVLSTEDLPYLISMLEPSKLLCCFFHVF